MVAEHSGMRRRGGGGGVPAAHTRSIGFQGLAAAMPPRHIPPSPRLSLGRTPHRTKEELLAEMRRLQAQMTALESKVSASDGQVIKGAMVEAHASHHYRGGGGTGGGGAPGGAGGDLPNGVHQGKQL